MRVPIDTATVKFAKAGPVEAPSSSHLAVIKERTFARSSGAHSATRLSAQIHVGRFR